MNTLFIMYKPKYKPKHMRKVELMKCVCGTQPQMRTVMTCHGLLYRVVCPNCGKGTWDMYSMRMVKDAWNNDELI